MKPIPYGRQSVSEEDIEAVVSVLKSDFLTQGPVVQNFERDIAAFVHGKFAVAANSATSVLHIAYLALGVGSHDIVWTTPITFVATSNAARYCGATVDFVDIDPKTYNLSADKLEEKLIKAKKIGKLPKVVVPVHFSGQPCDMERIFKLSNEYGFKVVEDASHALGATYHNNYIGCGEFCHISVFSFHPVKIITTGEGGVAVTNDKDLAAKMKFFSSHYITNNEELMTDKPDGAWYYQQLGLGFNYRMTDIQAALGKSQLSRVSGFVKRRIEIAKTYDKALADFKGLVKPFQLEGTSSAWHLYVVLVEERKRVFDYMRSKGINVAVHYIPVHFQPYYSALGFKRGDFPNAEKYYEQCLSLPIYPDLSSEQQDYVLRCLKEAVS